MATLTSASAANDGSQLRVDWTLDSDVPAGTVQLITSFGAERVGVTLLNGNRVGQFVTTNGTQLAVPTGTCEVNGSSVVATYPVAKLGGADFSAAGEAELLVAGEVVSTTQAS